MSSQINMRVTVQVEIERLQRQKAALYQELSRIVRAGKKWDSATLVQSEIDMIDDRILALQKELDAMGPVALPQFLRKQAD